MTPSTAPSVDSTALHSLEALTRNVQEMLKTDTADLRAKMERHATTLGDLTHHILQLGALVGEMKGPIQQLAIKQMAVQQLNINLPSAVRRRAAQTALRQTAVSIEASPQVSM